MEKQVWKCVKQEKNVLSFLDNPKYVLILYAENQIKKTL